MSRIVFAAALGLLVWSATTSREPERLSASGTVVHIPIDWVEEQSIGESEVRLRFHNPSSRSIKIVDVQEGCGKNCCFKPKSSGSQVIPPGGFTEVPGTLRVIASGPFEFVGDLYIDDAGLRVVKFTIRGDAHGPGR